MKRLFRALLTEHQWRTLRSAKASVYLLLAKVLVGLSKCLPERLVVLVRSHTQLQKRMDYQRADILLNIDSEVEYDVRLNSCAKEPEMIEWIETFFKEGEVFYDIGANVGAYSLVAAKFLDGKIRVYAFEPTFLNFKELCLNVCLNHCQDSIVALPIALSDRTGIEVLNFQNLMPGGALHAVGRPVDYKGEAFVPIHKQSVLVFTIDDLVHEFGMPVPNHLKIDVDGIEFQILKGAAKTLESESVKSMIVEIDEGDREGKDILAFLEQKGLHFHSKHQYVYGGQSGPHARIYNYIFRR